MGMTPDERTTFIVNIVLPALATAFVVARFASRGGKNAPRKADDWTIAVTLIFSVGVCISSAWGATQGIHGGPFHANDVPKYFASRKLLWSNIIICHFVFGLVKVSVLLLYQRIFTTKKFMMASNIMLILVSMWMIGAFFAMLFSTDTPEVWWTYAPGKASNLFNIDMGRFQTANAAIDMFLDIVILSLPIPMIKQLNVKSSKKIYLVVIFLLGGLCLITSAIRLYHANASMTIKDFKSPKFIKLSDANDLWQHIEACTCIIAACIPTLSPLVRKLATPDVLALVSSIRSLLSTSSMSSSRNESADRAGASASGDSLGSARTDADKASSIEKGDYAARGEETRWYESSMTTPA